ncbi:MAG: thioredoxin-like domain-containing protein [Pirellulales bacterium]
MNYGFSLLPRLLVGILGLAIVCQTNGRAAAQEAAKRSPAAANAANHPFPRRVPVPWVDTEAGWLNTTRPIKFEELRGKFVLIDFWTFCCINCIHVLPELKKLEQAYPNELVVVGVHSPKFAGERDAENVHEAIQRYEIEHPVLSDPTMTEWQKFGIQSWPTLVLVDPEGKAVWVGSGEKKAEEIREVIDRGLPYYRAKGLLNTEKLPFIKVAEPPNTPLRFPGKVIADDATKRLFIADSNHNRIVVTDLDGQVEHVIGNGQIGRFDGPFGSASFHHPQGIVLAGNVLVVADTENHLLREVNLATKEVTTIAGTGEQGGGFPGPAADGRFVGQPLSTALNSPWDLWIHDGELYIAMAGPHQIWKMARNGSEIGPYAGNGREDIANGKLLPAMPYMSGFASFAQPSGLASDGKLLFVADSEGSAIRSVPFKANGRVRTLVGVVGSLFDFGDVDGTGNKVRLQHPLGVVFHDGKLYIADTYNNKIKVLDPAKKTCETLAGTGAVGDADAENGKDAMFNEPAGITVAGDKLYVADTNNQAIRVVEIAPPHLVTTLKIEGLKEK